MYHASLIQERISSAVSRLECRKDSLVGSFNSERFEFVKSGGVNGEGLWVDRLNNNSDTVRLIFRLQRDVSRCGDFCFGNEQSMEPIILNARWRLHVTFTPTGAYASEVKEKLELQAKYLREMQSAHEVESQQPRLARRFGFVQEALDDFSPYCGVAISPLAFMWVPDVRPGVQTLADWYDPHGHLECVSGELLRSFVVNKNIKAYDFNGKLVDPMDYGIIFRGGTWLEADVRLRYSTTASPFRGQTDRFGLYQMEVDSFIALSDVSNSSRYIQSLIEKGGSTDLRGMLCAALLTASTSLNKNLLGGGTRDAHLPLLDRRHAETFRNGRAAATCTLEHIDVHPCFTLSKIWDPGVFVTWMWAVIDRDVLERECHTVNVPSPTSDLIEKVIFDLATTGDSLLHTTSSEGIELELDHESYCGKWIREDNGLPKSFNLIFQLDYGLNFYANFGLWPDTYHTSALAEARWQFTGSVPPSLDYSPRVREWLEAQAQNLMRIQAAHEACSHSPIRTKNFVDPLRGSRGYQFTVVSPRAFVRFDDVFNLGNETLEHWPDPSRLFARYRSRSLKRYGPNTTILAFDAEGYWVHPVYFPSVFAASTWVVSNVELRMTDIPAGVYNPPSRSYELHLTNIRALNRVVPLSVNGASMGSAPRYVKYKVCGDDIRREMFIEKGGGGLSRNAEIWFLMVNFSNTVHGLLNYHSVRSPWRRIGVISV
ncbi:hypothetical protein BD410DRAFT_805781 [Rickenella mellea]|uniref:Uncharacterized protein n=1 Tax=Rickenella mellea TaxID=50990 RepID=A0A4Y7PWS2_9AGAM|nr:hypothetical protein BD410DRAFT_805781 [Rickenella mellea]